MKKLLYLTIAFCFLTSLSFAAETFKGYIIDNLSADICDGCLNPDTLLAFAKGHSKEFVLKPECAASGYSIVIANGERMKFDKESNAKIEDFLKAPESKLQVTVEVKKSGKEIVLVSIKNQE